MVLRHKNKLSLFSMFDPIVTMLHQLIMKLVEKGMFNLL